MHPHAQEEMEYQMGPHPSSAQYDRDEATLGASWQTEEWNNQHPWLLTSHDIWVSNPHYFGPPCPHPEDNPDEESWEEWDEYWTQKQRHWHWLVDNGWLAEYTHAWEDAHHEELERNRSFECDDDIPF